MEKYRVLLIIVSVLIAAMPVTATATIAGPVPSLPCAPGGMNLDNFNSTCYWNNTARHSGEALWGKGQIIASGTGGISAGFDTSFVPYTGMYRMRLRACPNTQPARCSVANSTQYWDGTNSVQLSSTAFIVNQRPNFGSAPGGMLATASNLCWTFVDDQGNEWSTDAKRTCTGAHALPTTPAVCSLNYGEDLNVSLGELERKDIATVPLTTTTIKKEIGVLCTRDSVMTFNMHLQYNSINIGGRQLVSTSTSGLGVAIIYNGKAMSPSDSVPLAYGTGHSTLNLEFEAVRDPNVQLADIKTGAFTASATMIMTEQ